MDPFNSHAQNYKCKTLCVEQRKVCMREEGETIYCLMIILADAVLDIT